MWAITAIQDRTNVCRLDPSLTLFFWNVVTSPEQRLELAERLQEALPLLAMMLFATVDRESEKRPAEWGEADRHAVERLVVLLEVAAP